MEFERVYRGTVTSLRQITTSAFGIRAYEVWFGNRKAYFEISRKRTLPISINREIRFTAHPIALGSPKGLVWMIDEVLDSFPSPAATFGHERQLTATYRQ